jgi:hypothetical protein
MPRTSGSVNEISSLRRDLQLNGYPQSSTDLAINWKGSFSPSKVEQHLGSVCVPYVKVVSEKFKHIRNKHDVRAIFRTKATFRSSLMKPRLETEPQQTAQCL